MKTYLKATAAVLAAGCVMTVGPAVAGDPQGDTGRTGLGGTKLDVVGLTDTGTGLVSFEARKPGKTGPVVKVSGLTGGDNALIGIDYRVQDGKLYGVGNNAPSAGVYAIDPRTGVATQLTRLTVPLSGNTFGVDFNPAANALRVVSDTGQNLRQPFAMAGAATVADGALSYAAPAVATGINGAAYTNNDLDAATATTLFDLDTTLDQVAIQSPANAGTLVATGKLGFDAKNSTGFDIYSTLSEAKAVDNDALTVIGGALYTIDLLTGATAGLGAVGVPVSDIAIPLNQG